MQERVDERPAPLLAHDVWAQHDVAELARNAFGQLREAVDREGERIRRFVDAEVLALQSAALVRPHECEAELSRSDALAGEHEARELDRCRFVDLFARAI